MHPTSLLKASPLTHQERPEIHSDAREVTLLILESLTQSGKPQRINFRLWDGAHWPDDQPKAATFVLNRPSALKEMLLAGTEAGLGEAYIHSAFDIEGDLEAAFELGDILIAQTEGWGKKLKIGYLPHRLPDRKITPTHVSGQAARLAGHAHSLQRDRDAIQFHYDVAQKPKPRDNIMPTTDKPTLRKLPPEIHSVVPPKVLPPTSSSIPVVAATPSLPPPPQTQPEPQDLPDFEFLGYLPDSYGSKKLFLVARDPDVLFAYWDLSSDQYQAAVHAAKDGKVFLELYVPGEGRVQQIHVWDCHKSWYLQVNRPDTKFVAQLGYYRADGGFEILARSAEVHTSRDTLSPNTDARFVTIPFNVPFRELHDMIAAQALPGEELADTLARLQKLNSKLPFQAHVPRDLTPTDSDELLSYLGDEEIRRQMVGSLEISEILRKRYETALSSGQWNSSAGAWVTSLSSPFGASFGKVRGFQMHLNAELIIYGGSTPDAKVRVDGHEINLTKDGTFSYHFVFPDGNFHIPISATSADGAETRSALVSFLRMTEIEGDVRKTGQPKMAEPIGRK
jgi:hypothetical protein